VRFEWPLTGRSQELRLIEDAVSNPESSGIVVCGAAGVGKSRVAREALSNTSSHSREVRWVVGTSSATLLPLGALASWVPPDGDTVRLIQGVMDSLVAADSGMPVVVGVDDAHLLDDLSVFVLHQIAARQAAKLVLTVRAGDPVPAGVRELWQVGRFDRLDLQPLSRHETTELVAATLGSAVDPDAAERLWALTRGNVLYLRNIVQQEVADGRLAEHRGYWRWTGDPVLPPNLVELIEWRMGGLPPPVSDVVDVLAVGEPLRLSALRRITASTAVEEADLRGLITIETVDGRVEVRVAHPLYGEVRRKRAAPTRLRRLRGLVASELAARDDGNDVRIVVRRAALMVDSDLEPDPELLVRAAKRAVWLADHGLADRLAAAAIRAGAGAGAKLVRTQALSWLSRFGEAEEVFASIDTDGLGDSDHAALAFARAANRLVGLADPAGALELVDAAFQTIQPRARDCIDAFYAVYWALMGKPEKAMLASTSIALDRLPDPVGGMPAMALVIALGDAGRVTEAVNAAERGYSVVTHSLDSAGVRCAIADAHVRALVQAGRISDALEVAEQLRQVTAGLPGAAQVFSSAVVGRATLGAGRPGSALSLIEPMIHLVEAAGATNGIGYIYLPQRTITLAMRGLTERAVAALKHLEEHRHAAWRALDSEEKLARAWVDASQGAVSKAIALSLSAAETARANGQSAAEVMCLQTATQFGDRSCAARLHELAGIVEGPRVGAGARFAGALEACAAAELFSVSEEFEQTGDLVAAVDAAAHAALVYRDQGLRGKALLCSTRAEALAEQCGGISTPMLRQVVEPLPLTGREREITMLLTDGLTTREIADRLTLSQRTVEGHIYRAMGKTGTTSRDELAALVGRRKPSD
jgi:DNA-binding CsgD family transcriptional regulator